MKETTPSAMPPCFERWCKRFDDVFTHQQDEKGSYIPNGQSAKSGLNKSWNKEVLQVLRNL